MAASHEALARAVALGGLATLVVAGVALGVRGLARAFGRSGERRDEARAALVVLGVAAVHRAWMARPALLHENHHSWALDLRMPLDRGATYNDVSSAQVLVGKLAAAVLPGGPDAVFALGLAVSAWLPAALLLLVRRSTGGARAAWLAGLLVAFFPGAVLFARTEDASQLAITLVVTSAALACEAVERGDALAFVGGLAALVVGASSRDVALGLAPIAVIAPLVVAPRLGRVGFARLAAFTTLGVLALLPQATHMFAVVAGGARGRELALLPDVGSLARRAGSPLWVGWAPELVPAAFTIFGLCSLALVPALVAFGRLRGVAAFAMVAALAVAWAQGSVGIAPGTIALVRHQIWAVALLAWPASVVVEALVGCLPERARLVAWSTAAALALGGLFAARALARPPWSTFDELEFFRAELAALPEGSTLALSSRGELGVEPVGVEWVSARRPDLGLLAASNAAGIDAASLAGPVHFLVDRACYARSLAQVEAPLAPSVLGAMRAPCADVLAAHRVRVRAARVVSTDPRLYDLPPVEVTSTLALVELSPLRPPTAPRTQLEAPRLETRP